MKKFYLLLVSIAVLVYAPFLFGSEIYKSNGIPEFLVQKNIAFTPVICADCRDVSIFKEEFILSTQTYTIPKNTVISRGEIPTFIGGKPNFKGAAYLTDKTVFLRYAMREKQKVKYKISPELVPAI